MRSKLIQSWSAHYQLSQAYLRLRSIQAAYNELRETVALDPSNSDAQLQLATLLIASKKYDEAKAAATKVLKAEPNNVRAHQILGDQSALTGDFAGATREFRTAIELDPARLESYASLSPPCMHRGASSPMRRRCSRKPSRPTRSLRGLGSTWAASTSRSGNLRRLRRRWARHLTCAQRPPSRLMLANSYAAEGNFAEGEKICRELETRAQ